jgi:hypothetical protein
MLAAPLRPVATFGGAGADKAALEFSKPAENSQHQPPVRGRRVGPRVGEGSKPSFFCR